MSLNRGLLEVKIPFNLFLASGDFYFLLITVANSLDRLGPAECWSRHGSKPFVTLIVFLKEVFEKLILKEKSAEGIKSMKN